MKDKLTGKKYQGSTLMQIQRGSSTLEILVAFAVLVLSLTAVVMVLFGNQSVSVDTQTNNEALYKAQTMLEVERALSRQDFLSVSTTAPVSDVSGKLIYTTQLTVADVTPCKKQATSTVTWQDTGRPQKIELSTLLSDVAGALAMGGDCFASSASGSWKNPARFAQDTMGPGKPTALDELSRIVYIGADKSPFLYIADTHGATRNQVGGLFVTYANGFSLGATPNWLDAIQWINPTTGAVKYYVFAAMDTTINQLKVIDVTDPFNPTLVATRSLSGVSAGGSYPQGWILYYYKNRLYVTTRETTGPEFHTFDVSTPSSPTELGSGVSLNVTVDGMTVRDQMVAGVTKRFAYVATDQNSAELQVYNVTDPSNIGDATIVSSATQDLPGIQDGQSVYLVGNRLYFGRLSSSGPELYVYDVSNPTTGLTLLGSQDIGTGVLAIRVAGSLAFISTPKTNQEFQVWDISTLSAITSIATYNFGNIVNQGIDYDPDFIYSTGQATPNFQILYSGP